MKMQLLIAFSFIFFFQFHNSCTARYFYIICVYSVCHMSYSYFFFIFLNFFSSIYLLMYAAAGTLQFPHCGLNKHILFLKYSILF